ncbi:MAG TPA: FAD-dependent oxidoreductase [Acetobacteraceae bacterium]|nr:FAD-dependent oxidoreductase [Acetobacteraceae bacterium]
MSRTIIVGAGPYGLSLAAHLRARNVEFRIFGSPMQFWRQHAPPGMLLKSLGAASDLSDPQASFPIAKYCTDAGVPYDDRMPVSAETFVDYGDAFQRRFVPQVDERHVVAIRRDGAGYSVRLEDGETVGADRVVVAVGVQPFTYVPPALCGLPSELVTHSVAYGDIGRLVGRRVVVVGSGASATDLAVALKERGTDVSILSRRPQIRYQSKGGPRKLRHRLRSPESTIGGGWDLWFYANYPQLFRLLPEQKRYHLVQTVLGAAPGWFVREKVEGQIPVIGGQWPEEAREEGGRVLLRTRGIDGGTREIEAEQVVAATGYKVDLDRLGFLDEGLRRAIRTAHGVPVLSASFESSAKGLHFIGVAASHSFGPVMRFVAGSGYTVRKLAAALDRPAPAAEPMRQPAFAEG